MADSDEAELWEELLCRSASPIVAVVEKSLARIGIEFVAELGKDIGRDSLKDFVAGIVTRFALIPPLVFLLETLHIHISLGG